MIIFRHAETKYSQKIVSLDDANDITYNGILHLREKVKDLESFLGSTVTIKSSPLGRCLATSKEIAHIISDIFPVIDIQIEDRLEEIKFKYSLINFLISGGIYRQDGNFFYIDPKITNPNNLSFGQYLLSSQYLNVLSNNKRGFPIWLDNSIAKSESFLDSQKRFFDVLKKSNDDTILVTHAGISHGLFVNGYSGSEPCLGLGEFLKLDSDLCTVYWSQNN